MPRRDDRDPAYLDDIVEACAVIVSRTRNKSLPDFVADGSLHDGIILQLIVVGESSKNLTETTKKHFKTIAWRDMARLRDLAAHHYHSLDLLKIWNIATDDVPQLLHTLSRGK
jgi:uncharacterized protein with HEPN domain